MANEELEKILELSERAEKNIAEGRPNEAMSLIQKIGGIVKILIESNKKK